MDLLINERLPCVFKWLKDSRKLAETAGCATKSQFKAGDHFCSALCLCNEKAKNAELGESGYCEYMPVFVNYSTRWIQSLSSASVEETYSDLNSRRSNLYCSKNLIGQHYGEYMGKVITLSLKNNSNVVSKC